MSFYLLSISVCHLSIDSQLVLYRYQPAIGAAKFCLREYEPYLIDHCPVYVYSNAISMSYHNAYEKKGCLFKSNPPYSEMPNRAIVSNVPDLEVCNNSIRTYKYSLLTFIPLNLMVQFSKLPNVYFLVVGLMQMIPQITISGGFPVIFVPLSIVVAVSAIKDFYEDLKRKRSDEEINSHPATKLTLDGYQQVSWTDIHIGDIVRVKQNEQFPADIILLQSSDDRLNCFIETKNLDGETNLKHKQVKFELGSALKKYSGEQEAELYDQRLYVKYERPNPFIYTFTGSWGNVPLDCNNVVLRGCTLRITKQVSGLVIYTGVDSKIMLNSNKTRQKKSRLYFKMGIIVIVVFLLQLLLTFTSAFLSTVTTPHLVYEYTALIGTMQTLLIKWGGWILLFTNFVPISLIVSLEMVKYIQGTNISASVYQTNAPAEVVVQTSTLNEELGQIQHLFSDKTGTLTKNYMSFKYCAIGSKVYGLDSTPSVIPHSITNVDFHDREFLRSVSYAPQYESSLLHAMLVSLSCCHSVIIEEDEQGNKRYNASSPDYLAFINMAKYCGWEFEGLNSNNELTVRTKWGDISYKLLHTLEFNSDRKRMSIIVEKDYRIFVFCKGADNIILKRLSKHESYTAKSAVDTALEKVSSWSRIGLRTMLFARREIKREDYEKWARMYALSLSRLEQAEKDEKVKMKREIYRKLTMRENVTTVSGLDLVTKLIIEDEVTEELLQETPELMMNRLLNDNSRLTEAQKQFMRKYLDKVEDDHNCTSQELEDMLEKELSLIGVTAAEDQLQDNVKETIQVIRKAGVKVWMLTGDKKETAINIGLSCGLLASDMAIVYWTNSLEQTVQSRRSYPESRECCLVASGYDLLRVNDYKMLLGLVNSCKAIICCRVSPKQKQEMVWLMRKNKCTTLGIGDGANDVNMINTAHVGVGIKGVEGAQAALCSDYAISEFQILRELMLYHGRESYRKNSQLILFNFYKNFLLAWPQLWFGLYNQFSSATIYDPWIYQLYNVLFTSFPIVIYAIYDQQHSVYYSLHNPTLYHSGLNNYLFRPIRIVLWLVIPIICTYIITVVNWSFLESTIISSGFMGDLMFCGMNIFAQCVIISNVKVLILSYSPSVGLYLSVIAGIGFFYILSFVAYGFFPFGNMRNIFHMQTHSLSYWVTCFYGVSLVAVIYLIMSHWNYFLQLVDTRNVQFEEIEMGTIRY